MREVYFKFVGPHFIEMEAKDMEDKEKQERIWEHCKRLSEEMLEWDKQEEDINNHSKEEIDSFYRGK